MYSVSLSIDSVPSFSPSLRGDVLQPGDPVHFRGEYMVGKTGSRFFGWLPGVAWKPRVCVREDGKMFATRSDGEKVRYFTALHIYLPCL